MKTRNRKSQTQTRLIVAASETDPDMLYATKFWAPDPFIFLERNGKRTLVLSDLEIDRGRKQAEADEFVSFNQLEREVQGKSKKAPPYEKILAHFLRKRGVRSTRSEEHTSELQSRVDLVCRLLLEKKKKKKTINNLNQKRQTLSNKLLANLNAPRVSIRAYTS